MRFRNTMGGTARGLDDWDVDPMTASNTQHTAVLPPQVVRTTPVSTKPTTATPPKGTPMPLWAKVALGAAVVGGTGLAVLLWGGER